MTTATQTPNLAAETTAPAAPQTDNFAESNFQAYKEAENREALDRVAGKLPTRAKETQPPPSGSAPETEEEPSHSADLTPADGTRAELPPAQPQKGKTKEDTRKEFEKLTTSNRELKAERDAFRVKVEEYERQRTQPQPPPAPARTPELQPAPAAKVTRPEPTKDDIDPATKQPKYATFGDLLAAQREWDREQVMAQFEEKHAKTQREAQQQEQTRVINDGWGKKVEVARKKYADYDKIALNPDLKIPAGSVPDAFVLDSEHGADVMHYLGQHPELLDTFYETAKNPDGSLKITKHLLNPMRQHRALLEIEAQFSKPSPSARRTSAAPAPPHEVSGQGAVPPDETEQALSDDDFPAYKAAENRKALAKAKGK